MERIVDISTDGQHIAIYRGFLTVGDTNGERGRVAMDDIAAVVAHAHGLTWSNSAFVKLAERNIPVILCGANHAPKSVLYPIEGFHAQGARMRCQAGASRPLKKQLWKQIVVAKLGMQGRVISASGGEEGPFELLARRVRSGDPENMEAQAARRYWAALFGARFRRDRNSAGINALLNYGYTVLRATVSRAICAAGLHPTLGIHHSNRSNAFALADDLMEPYRPLVDQMVFNMSADGIETVDPEAKSLLAGLSTLDLQTGEGMSPLHVQVGRLAHSLAVSFETAKAQLALPSLPTPLELSGLARSSGR